jgi:diaminopimelate decarboxylase
VPGDGAVDRPELELAGVHCHLGSQLGRRAA